MNLFYSPPVRTYSILASHHQACEIVDSLIKMGCVQFEMSAYDDPSDPFYLIYSRIKQLKFRLMKLIETIESKYEVSMGAMSGQQKIGTIMKMKAYIQNEHIDYLRYLDLEEHNINHQLMHFNTSINAYDYVAQTLEEVQEQIDTLRFKAEILSQDFASQQFAIITGTCLKKDRVIIQRLLFRKTHGHCYSLFKERDSKSDRDVLICFINKMAYNRIKEKLVNIFKLNQAHLFELPNLEKHLNSYEKDLIKKRNEIQKLLEISSQQLMGTLKESIKRFQAGQQFLLSKDRRTVWKIGLFQYYQEIDLFSRHSFVENPQTDNEQTKARFYQISLDVNRTFAQTTQLQRQQLSIVLQNLNLYFEGVGYTQGMNFFVGFFLLCGFTSKETFQIMIRLSYNNSYLLIRNFTEGFKNVNLCISIFEELMQKHPNKNLMIIKLRIEEMGLNTFFYSFSWFLSYFLYNLGLRSCALVLDYLLLHSHESDDKQIGQGQNKNQPAKASTSKKYNDICSLGRGLVNLVILALNIIQALSQKLILCFKPEEIMNVLRHDNIQKQMTEEIIYHLVMKSKMQHPLLTQTSFMEFTRKYDEDAYKIMTGGDLIRNKKNKKSQQDQEFVLSYNQFFNDCKFLKRKVTVKPNKSQVEGFKEAIAIQI